MTALAPKPRVKLSKLRDIGWRLWDPIGLLAAAPDASSTWIEANTGGFADEYDRYLRSAAAQLRDGAAHADVATYLMRVECDHMGLGETATTRSRAEAVVAAIAADEAIWTWPDAQGRVPTGDENRRFLKSPGR